MAAPVLAIGGGNLGFWAALRDVFISPFFLDSGRPVSISFVGKLFGEAELLAVAKAYQDTTGFHLLHPES